MSERKLNSGPEFFLRRRVDRLLEAAGKPAHSDDVSCAGGERLLRILWRNRGWLCPKNNVCGAPHPAEPPASGQFQPASAGIPAVCPESVNPGLPVPDRISRSTD